MLLRTTLVLLALALPLPAAAALVTIAAEFTSFAGVVGSDGQFETYINGDLVCPDAGCGTGIGSLSYALAVAANGISFQNSSFGVLQPVNEIVFTPAAPQNTELGEQFLLGTLSYENGTWFTDPEFGIELTTQSADPALDGLVFSDVLHLSITTNLPTNTPRQNADFLAFVNDPGLGSLRAYELADSPNGSNLVSIDVYGVINSLHVTELANATGGGFFDPSVRLDPSAPEPTASSLLLAGASGLAWLRRRRSRG